jgi:hypothetical protein
MISRESSGDIRSVSQYKLILKKIKGQIEINPDGQEFVFSLERLAKNHGAF